MVSVSYRLAVLGWLPPMVDQDDATNVLKGNYGLTDVWAAIRWLKRYAAVRYIQAHMHTYTHMYTCVFLCVCGWGGCVRGMCTCSTSWAQIANAVLACVTSTSCA